jgi:hypothetical protein
MKGATVSTGPPTEPSEVIPFPDAPGLAEEFHSLYRRARNNAVSLTTQATFWYRARWTLAIAASLLAAIAGVAGVAKLIGAVPAGVLSLSSALLTSLLTVVNPVERQHNALKLANQYNEVAGMARRSARGFGPKTPTWDEFDALARDYRQLRGEQIDFRPALSAPREPPGSSS